MSLTDPGKLYLRGAQNSAFASTMDTKEQKMDQKGQKCFAKKVMAKLSAKYRVGICGVSSPFMDQIHKVIFDRLPYSKYLSELGQNRPTAGKA